MHREDDVRIDVGRASHGGDFMRLVHVRTGIMRLHPGPLANIDRRELVERWCAEIEGELQEKGLSRHLVAEALPAGSPGVFSARLFEAQTPEVAWGRGDPGTEWLAFSPLSGSKPNARATEKVSGTFL